MKITVDGEPLQTEAEKIDHLRRQIKALTNQNQGLRVKLADKTEFLHELQGAVTAATPFPREQYPKQTKKPQYSSEVVPVLMLSDWHIGEVVNANETEGLNAYDLEIARSRMFTIVDAFIRHVNAQRQIYKIKEAVVFGLGDYVSGDIHPELQATNEFPLPQQTAEAGSLLGEVIARIACCFDTVTTYCQNADNHGRLQKKPQAKQKGGNNMSYLVHTIAEAHARKVTNAKFVHTEGAKLLANVNGKRFLLEHGDAIRGWAGFPYYGFGRMAGLEAQRRMLRPEIAFDYQCMGHFHVPAVISWKIYVNGSLSGTSEFDYICGRHADPAQVGFLVHPQHGIINWNPFRTE
jgi:hypothetical protein